jgi:hypothetical protein
MILPLGLVLVATRWGRGAGAGREHEAKMSLTHK